jgi:two-component system sensor histidine kinase CiaH
MQNGKKTIRKELIKNMIFNVVLFTILFTIFSLFIFYQVDKYLYTSIDSQLMQIKANLSDITKMNPPNDFKKPKDNEKNNTVPEIGINYKEDSTNTNVEFGIINEEEPNDLPEIPFETEDSKETELGREIEQIKKEVEMRFSKVGNLRVVAILRDAEGQILGTSYRNDLFSDFINGISFDKGNVGKIYNLSLNDEIFYRGTAVEIESNSGEKYYVDLLINTNSENEMLNRFLHTLTLGTGISILLSIFISYYLANKSIKPIVKSY